jgi:hypothetical protein
MHLFLQPTGSLTISERLAGRFDKRVRLSICKHRMDSTGVLETPRQASDRVDGFLENI